MDTHTRVDGATVYGNTTPKSVTPSYLPPPNRRAYEAVRDRNADPALTRILARSGGNAKAGDEMAAVR